MKINSTARHLKERNLEYWIVIFVMIGSFAFPFLAAAQERKSIEEVLVDKGVLSPEEAASVQGRKFSKWVDRMTFSGDLRLRHESFMKDPDRDRSRQRFRLRFGPEIKIDNFIVGIRLASGTGEQTSTNQSFDNFFSQKQLWIDRAYLQWRAPRGFTLTGGRMPNPFFTLYTTDIVWDEDVNPEGVAESAQLKLSDNFVLFANAGQFVLDEDSGDNNDQWLFGEQAGVQIGLGKAARFTVAGTFYNFKNAARGDFGQVTVQEGNTRVAATPPATGLTSRLVNPYRVLDISAELAMEIGGFPVALQGDYVKNLADTTTDKDTGYQAGVLLGKASNPGSWELAYYYKYVETDATVGDLADADFGDGGTNRKGHIVWVAYQFHKALQFKTKFFDTRVEDETLPPFEDDIKRLQVDLVMKF